ncbi:MAG: hypothetical protein PHU23_10585, partial [Dehalococcoidales bacterium]|nr:hypothetical protein [Dehalococcoidales bacterium]
MKNKFKTYFFFLIISLGIFGLAKSSLAADYYVSPVGVASWANSTNISTPCSLSTANSNAAAGDTVYLRAGTYTITGTGIAPVNSGTSASNMITFSGYGLEEAIIYGVNDVTGRASQGINLYNNSYIKVTKLILSNLSKYLYITNGSHHNEVSYCTFKDMRDVWNVDVIKTGTHTGPTGSSMVLEDSNLGGGTNTYAYRVIHNITDGSYSFKSSSSTATTVTHTAYPLWGGKNNYWSTGDQYKITWGIQWAGSYIYEGDAPEAAVSHNWIHHNTFHNYGAYTNVDEGVVLELGVGNSSANINCNYNTIEDNNMYAGGHHILGINASRYNVIRNNYIHNEGWCSSGNCAAVMENGLCGYRVVSATVPSTTFGGYSLWEGNRVGHGSAYGGSHFAPGAAGSGTTLATPKNIYRYNDHFNNALYGLRLGASISTAGNDNRVYNNSFYHNGYGADDDANAYDNLRMGISLYNTSCAAISGTVIKNNLFYDHWSEQNNLTTKSYYPAIFAVSAENLTCNTITNNFNASISYISSNSQISNVDPIFTDPDITTPSSTTKPNLTLQTGSPAIDGGTYLTQANGSGSNSTTLIVND